jgi:hypothetical protein
MKVSGSDRAPGAIPSVLICLLGDFRVIKVGVDVGMRSGSKSAMLLSSLVLGDHYRVSRQFLWGSRIWSPALSSSFMLPVRTR